MQALNVSDSGAVIEGFATQMAVWLQSPGIQVKM